MEHRGYSPTDGSVLRRAREAAGVSQGDVARRFLPRPTTRQRLSRLERDGEQVSHVDAVRYMEALDAAVAEKVRAA